MARDLSGNFSLAAGNPVTAGTSITAAWANATLSDIADEITNSLDRNGRGGMLAAFKFADGTLGSPALTFTNETGSGIYRAGANDVRLGIGGSLIQKWTASGIAVTGTVTASGGYSGIAKANLPAVGQQVSAEGGLTASSSSYADATNLTVTITTTGRPVLIGLMASGDTGNPVQFYAAGGAAVAGWKVLRDSTVIAFGTASASATGLAFPLPPVHLDPVAAGTYTYKLQLAAVTGVVVLSKAKFYAYEL